MRFGGLRLILVMLTVLLPNGAAAGGAMELHLAPGGLEAIGTGGFAIFLPMEETSQAEALKAATRFWQPPVAQGTMEECGAGPIDFAIFGNGMTLHFQDGAFVGWATAPGAEARFADGRGIGSKVADIETVAGPVEAFESSIGNEFAADDVFGIASGPGTNATVEMLWSGVSCIFR